MNPEIANAIAGFANATNTLFDVLEHISAGLNRGIPLKL
jgi:hypothetical protein